MALTPLTKTYSENVRLAVEQKTRRLDQQLNSMEQREFDKMHNQESEEEGEYSEYEEDEILEYLVESTVEAYAFAFEAFGLVETRSRFLAQIEKVKSESGFKAKYIPHADIMDCRAREVLEYFKVALDTLFSSTKENIRNYELSRLEELLKDTVHHVKTVLNRSPKSETDVQNSVGPFIRAVFPDFTRAFTLPKPVKNFKPDGGIPSLKAAIEHKFITSETELNVAISGILEDMNGYAGSKDWELFYAVLYMTDHFHPEASISAQ